MDCRFWEAINPIWIIRMREYDAEMSETSYEPRNIADYASQLICEM